MAAPVNHRKWGGRKPGQVNKFTMSMKMAFEHVFEMRGGEQALLAWSNENPDLFYQLIGKLLPRQVDVDISGQINLSSVIEKARKRATGADEAIETN